MAKSLPSRKEFKCSHRAFSSASSRQFADVNNTVDPRQMERENDEVDVCIVGGGGPIFPDPLKTSDSFQVPLD